MIDTGQPIGVSDELPIISSVGQVFVKCWPSVGRDLETLPPREAWEVSVQGNAFKSISKEISMEINHLLKAGFGRRGFLSGSSLLLTGALLGAAEEAKGAPVPAPPEAVPQEKQDKDALLADLVTANHILQDQGVVDGYGHVSVRNPANPNHFYISRWLAPDLVTVSDIVELDYDCVPANGDTRKLYSERWIHAEIYRARPDVKSIVHTHAPTVVLMGTINEPLLPIYHMGGFIGTGLPTFDIRKNFGMTNMLINDAAKGKALAQTLGDRPAALMRGHGGITVGNSIMHSVGRSVYLKINAEMHLQAGSRKIETLSPEEAHQAEVGNQEFPKDWDLWARKVKKS
jgi:ribulose-5-phosphate 4-epimerase/fuculose-1-phosphate aldolase